MNKGHATAVSVERLSWDEIRRRFPDQWVTLVGVDWTDESSFEFESAVTVGHGKRRSDAMLDAESVLPQFEEFGCFFTGQIRGPIPRFVIA